MRNWKYLLVALALVFCVSAVAEGAGKTVEPMRVEIDVASLPDGIWAVSFSRDDITADDSGIVMNHVRIFDRDVYDIVDINTLAAGDTFVTEGQSYEVRSVEKDEEDGCVYINGGYEELDGWTLMPVEEDNCYRVLLFDDLNNYTELGETSLTVDPSVTYTDSSDLEAEPVTAGYDDLVDTILSAEQDIYDQWNTTIRVEGGRVVEIERIFVP